MKTYKFLSVIMVLALCFGTVQSVEAKKKKNRKIHKKEKVQTAPEQVVEDERVVGAVEVDKGNSDMLIETVNVPPLPTSTTREYKKPESSASDEDVFKSAAHMPSFPGGDAALMDFISKNIKYPHETCAQGKVIVQFVVKKNGKVGDVRVARGVDPYLDKEAVRVCKLLPNFSPGRNAVGDPVNVWYTLPITFKVLGAVEDGPTGDYSKDARQAGEKILEILNRDIKSIDDLEQMEKDIEALQKKYEDFYKARGEEELKKFNAALNALEHDNEISKRLEEAQRNFEEKAAKIIESK